MRQGIKKLLSVLDGQPRQTRGQSLVEMALTTPILILMVLGMAEIGFLANNYLILMDAVREAGRKAVNLNPSTWDPKDDRNTERMDCDGQPNQYSLTSDTSNVPAPILSQRYGYGPRQVQGQAQDTTEFGFFDSVACQAIISMAPLKFNPAKDDIVISAVSYIVTHTGPAYVKVTGRWPVSNRQCGSDTRDPFVWDPNNPTLPDGFPQNRGGVRGFVLTGQHTAKDGCIGSDFTVDEIERRLNLNIGDNQPEDAALLNNSGANGGLALIEIHWQHHPLFFGPLFEGYNGNPDNDPMIDIYGFFPVIQAEPTPTPIPVG